jgi:hypothetical protein
MDMDGDMGSRFPQERGSNGGELFMCINPMPLSKIIILYEPYVFLLSVSKPQSLNTCKSFGLKSHPT